MAMDPCRCSAAATDTPPCHLLNQGSTDGAFSCAGQRRAYPVAVVRGHERQTVARLPLLRLIDAGCFSHTVSYDAASVASIRRLVRRYRACLGRDIDQAEGLLTEYLNSLVAETSRSLLLPCNAFSRPSLPDDQRRQG
jgi:hypothetical protein